MKHTWRSEDNFAPLVFPFMWVLEIELGIPGLHIDPFHQLVHVCINMCVCVCAVYMHACVCMNSGVPMPQHTSRGQGITSIMSPYFLPCWSYSLPTLSAALDAGVAVLMASKGFFSLHFSSDVVSTGFKSTGLLLAVLGFWRLKLRSSWFPCKN